VSVRALSWALREAPVESKVELLVLIVLCDHAHDDGNGAYPSVATIARMARASESGVDVALKSLRRAGLIEAKPRPGRTTIYRVVMTPPASGPLQPVDPSSHWTPPLQPLDPNRQ
jgi:DNA-binding transcriptional ArsR family regulator